MGDVAVGARSGHDGPEEPEHSGYGSGTSTEAVGVTPDPADGDGEGRSRHRRSESTKKPRSFWKELPLLVLIALVLALLIKLFLVQAFSIPSASMENTLQIGDRVLVDKLTPWFGSEPERGEVVVFKDPDNWLAGEPAPKPNAVQRVLGWIGLMPSADEKDLIKRVIGVAGDTIECKGTGPVKVNGKPLNDSYIYAGNTPCSADNQGGQFKVTVPQGKIWVMGDHRQNSLDSRYHQQDKNHGFVPVGNVVGRAFVIAWPPTRWSTLPVPDTFHQSGISAAASSAAPDALGLAGAVPLVIWRRRRIAARHSRVTDGRTAG
ncbi:signal peptidase I [Streptomyces sp. NPDC050560]|uniref:signal peptidase I n=1 Tax=Streptomyces sp. NPDC050560 TaxID=3365630 RepID=UPI00379EE6A7